MNYICNKVGTKDHCGACVHSEPHEKINTYREMCTQWGICYGVNVNEKDKSKDSETKVRCILIKTEIK